MVRYASDDGGDALVEQGHGRGAVDQTGHGLHQLLTQSRLQGGQGTELGWRREGGGGREREGGMKEGKGGMEGWSEGRRGREGWRDGVREGEDGGVWIGGMEEGWERDGRKGG